MRLIFNKSLRKTFEGKKKLLLILSFLSYTIIIITATSIQVRNGIIGNFIVPVIKKNFVLPIDYFKSLFIDIKPLIIDVKHKDIVKISQIRDKALQRGELFNNENNWVNARISFDDEKYKVKLRLKGMFSDHWRDDNLWSYKVKVSDGKTILGMKRFAIQHPRTRDYMSEWYFNKMLANQGLISPRYRFNTVIINGEKYPIYAIEENFDKRLIENNNRREGPIFKLRSRGDFVNKRINGLVAYQENIINSSENSTLSLRRAERLIRGFLNGKLAPEEVFDIKLMAKAIAISDLFGQPHSLDPRNIKYYLNPVTGLIEPIPFDNSEIDYISKKGLFGERYLQSGDNSYQNKYNYHPKIKTNIFVSLLTNEKFSYYYGKALEEISDLNWLNNFFLDLEKEAKLNTSKLHRSYPWYQFQGKKYLYKNAEYIRLLINPIQALDANIIGDLNSSSLSGIIINNNHSLPVEIYAIKDQGGKIISYFDKPKFIPNRLNSCQNNICRRGNIKQLDSLILKFRDESINVEKFDNLRLVSRVVGTSNEFSDPLLKTSEITFPKLSLENSELLKINEDKREIHINKGYWTLDKDLIIPNGYELVVKGGTIINLLNKSSILSYSPIIFIGTKDNPIIIKSEDGTGQGLIVLQAKSISSMSHVIIRNQSFKNKLGITLTGALTFYESDVDLDNVQFLNNSAEDSLNIVRSNFSISKSSFSDSFSDAIDIDFGKGEIKDSKFFDIGNDGIDVSGSDVKLSQIEMINVGDKGISVGERSKVKIEKIIIRNAPIGVAVKDSSSLKGNDISLNFTNIGITSYQKKSEYGASKIFLNDLFLDKVEKEYLIEDNSKFILNNQNIKSNSENVYYKLYGSN
tara:strand:+ start:1564 stop:4143 length:2580 start_codon:yes stop_codon:yes gene_type:complete